MTCKIKAACLRAWEIKMVKKGSKILQRSASEIRSNFFKLSNNSSGLNKKKMITVTIIATD